jgi:ubiquinone/menaquinone biosynthesis C-methylase UbiE
MRRPRFIAEQARHAKGPLGRLIAFVMARETFADNQRAIDALCIGEDDHVLDVGCGHGRSLAAIAEKATKGLVSGADPSDLMAEIAVERNQALVKSRRVNVVIAAAGDLPFPDATFDKALSVHVVYFWEVMTASFREIAGVMKPGGTLALVFRTDADEAAVRAFPADVYSFRSLAEVATALERVGFSVQATDQSQQSQNSAALLLATKIPERARM